MQETGEHSLEIIGATCKMLTEVHFTEEPYEPSIPPGSLEFALKDWPKVRLLFFLFP